MHSQQFVKVENYKHLYLIVGCSKIEQHACANLESILPYSHHFFADVQGAPHNYFQLLKKYVAVNIES